MFQRIVDSESAKYFDLSREDKIIKLREVQKTEGKIADLMWFFAITMAIIGLWMSQYFGYGGIEFAVVFFAVGNSAMVAFARSSKNTAPLYVLLGVTLLSAIATMGVYTVFFVYDAVFIWAELRLIAMKNLPGYPLFEEANTDRMDKKLTEQQLYAYEIKQLSDINSTQEQKMQDKQNLDKILSGEMDLDEYLGVDKLPGGDMDKARQTQYDKYEASLSYDESGGGISLDGTVDEYFDDMEKRRRIQEKQVKAREERLAKKGLDDSAENFYKKFESGGGTLNNSNESAVQKNIKTTFQKAVNSTDGGNNG